ncbi:MAG: exodeoxyribonuclease III [Candidatus Omnitrophica bacterium]|nr:exodeoxyribonuclease III [Candidatus Omnitrophota bacterium]
MKFISWNVNGIRSVIKKGFSDFVSAYSPEILCLQETRAEETEVVLHLPFYESYWNPAKKKGYAGTAVLTKIPPMAVTRGIANPKHDEEGRLLSLEFNNFYLVNVYTPNSKRDLSRLTYRTEEWDVDFLKYLKRLERSKPVIFCGDLNVAHTEIDLSNPEKNHHTHGFTDEERRGFDRLLNAGFIDTFREFTREGGHYTWWGLWRDCRKRNIGWRIDYFCISAVLRPLLQDAFILSEVMGSDHCPVGIEMDFQSAS